MDFFKLCLEELYYFDIASFVEMGLHGVQWEEYKITKCNVPYFVMGRVVGIATGYGLVRGSNPRGGRDFPHLSKPALGPTQPPVQGISRLSRG